MTKCGVARSVSLRAKTDLSSYPTTAPTPSGTSPTPASNSLEPRVPPVPRCEGTGGTRGSSELLAGVGDVPDGVGAVVGYEERSVFALSDTDRATPHFVIAYGEAGKEVFILAGGAAVLHWQAHNFVSTALGAIPRAVFAGETVAFVLGRELGALIEEHLERRHVRVHEDVRGDELRYQFGVLA